MTSYPEPTYPSSSRGDATEHNARIERGYSEQGNSRSRSRRSHRCITIRRGGPASGRPRGTPRAVDRDRARFTIVSGWSGC